MLKLVSRFMSAAAIMLLVATTAHAEIVLNTGSFTGENHSTVSSEAVSAFKTQAAAIDAGGYVSQTDYQPMEISHLKPGYTTGNDAYTVGALGGLVQNDVVKLVESQQWRATSSGSWEEYYGFTSYVLIGDYTHNSTSTILNWLNYITNDGDGTYTFFKGSGQYWLVDESDPENDLDSVVGAQMRVVRDFEVWRGSTLNGMTQSSRGYYTGTSITGGSLAGSFDDVSSVTLNTVPEPSTIVLLLVAGFSALAFARVRRTYAS